MNKKKVGAPVAKASTVSRGGRHNLEALLARIETVRLAQRTEGNFDCFGTAKSGYCDQWGCAYHSDCLGISQQMF